MDYVTVRELRSESGKVWKRIEAGEEIVVTRNGKPFALLLHTGPMEVEAALRAHRSARMGVVLERIQTHAQARGLSRLTADQIDAEIAAVRKVQRSANGKPRRR